MPRSKAGTGGSTDRNGRCPVRSQARQVQLSRRSRAFVDPAGRARLAFQHVEQLTSSTWPSGDIPQQLHLDLSVPTSDALVAQHQRALSLGARLLHDRFDDPQEPLYVYADPAGHPFCIFVAPNP